MRRTLAASTRSLSLPAARSTFADSSGVNPEPGPTVGGASST
jgi:hypothetical protein